MDKSGLIFSEYVREKQANLYTYRLRTYVCTIMLLS